MFFDWLMGGIRHMPRALRMTWEAFLRFALQGPLSPKRPIAENEKSRKHQKTDIISLSLSSLSLTFVEKRKHCYHGR